MTKPPKHKIPDPGKGLATREARRAARLADDNFKRPGNQADRTTRRDERIEDDGALP